MTRGTITRGGKSWLLKFEGPRVRRQAQPALLHGPRHTAGRTEGADAALLGEADTNKLPNATRDTVTTYLRTYLDVLISVSPRTRERYQELAERQIIPHLGGAKIR